MYNNSILWGLLLVFACGNTVPENELEFLYKTKIEIPEPSGATYHQGSLFVISDATSFLYQLSLSGKLENKFQVDVKGMEGIVYEKETERFILISESKRTMTYFSLVDGQRETHKIKGKQTSVNKGLEGTCYNSKKKALLILNEDNPKQLLKNFFKRQDQKKYNLGFGKDVSGIVYDSKLDVYWVLSDEAQALFKISTEGKKLQKFPLQIKKPEGIALDQNRRLYIVSDSTSELFVYQLK